MMGPARCENPNGVFYLFFDFLLNIKSQRATDVTDYRSYAKTKIKSSNKFQSRKIARVFN